MKTTLEVCLVVSSVAMSIVPSASAQAQFASGNPQRNLTEDVRVAGIQGTPAMREGISVKLPVTSHAVPMPDADREDSWVVSVVADGRVYFGVEPVSPADLVQKIKRAPFRSAAKKVYIKADSRSLYRNVAKVLDAVHAAGFESLNLLTAQSVSSKPETIVPPKGLEVSVDPKAALHKEAIVAQLLDSGDRSMLKINDEEFPRNSAEGELRKRFGSRREKVVVVNAGGNLQFAEVVDAIDVVRSTGATVVLAGGTQ